jgi:hypothetical protein
VRGSDEETGMPCLLIMDLASQETVTTAMLDVPVSFTNMDREMLKSLTRSDNCTTYLHPILV